MQSSTRGIVLQFFKYSETSIIARIFTESFGLQSYMVKGIRSKRSRTRLALFQPLTLLDLVVDQKESRSLQHLRETTVAFPYHHLNEDVNKRSILLFLQEILIKSLREENPDRALFNWLFNSLTWLELTDKEVSNFHLLLMTQLSRFLGFYPKVKSGGRVEVFDLQEGQLTEHRPPHPHYLAGIVVEKVSSLLECPLEEIESLSISTEQRRVLLDTLVNYFQLHLPGFGEVKSALVLKEILA